MVLTGNFPEIRLKYVALEWKRELYFTVENFPGRPTLDKVDKSP
jgi:hypothetical protein